MQDPYITVQDPYSTVRIRGVGARSVSVEYGAGRLPSLHREVACSAARRVGCVEVPCAATSAVRVSRRRPRQWRCAPLPPQAFIVGDRFTAADLTFASLASPLLSVPQFAAIFPPHRFPPQLQSTTQALRATPAGQHALKCYASFRFASLAPDGMNLLPSDPSANLQRPLTIRSGGPRNNFLALTAAVLVVATPCALIVQQLYTRRAIDASRSNTGS